jgi:hypothetical protein
MSKTPSKADLAGWRSKAELFDELVERLAIVEDELERLKRAPGIDPAWREIANELASALRPYTLFKEQRVRDGRIVVETTVPGSTLSSASHALDRLADQVATESYRRDGLRPDWRKQSQRRAA